MQRTDVIHAMNVIGALAEVLEHMPEARTADGRINDERTDWYIQSGLILRDAELVLMQVATGAIPGESSAKPDALMSTAAIVGEG